MSRPFLLPAHTPHLSCLTAAKAVRSALDSRITGDDQLRLVRAVHAFSVHAWAVLVSVAMRMCGLLSPSFVLNRPLPTFGLTNPL